MILQIAAKKQHSLSRAAILPDHIHMLLRPSIHESPGDVALAYMNNLAHAHGMQPRFQFGYYAGTCGDYDMGAIWKSLAVSQGSTDAGSVVAENHAREF